MAHAPVVSQSILTQPAVADAFRAFWANQNAAGDVERILTAQRVLPGMWRLFLASPEYHQGTAEQCFDAVEGSTPLPGQAIASQRTRAEAATRALRSITPEQPAVVAAVVTPVPPQAITRPPVPVVAPPEPAISVAEQGLLGLIATGLKQMGFAPDKAITADQARSIADDAALSLAETIQESILRQVQGTLDVLTADLAAGKFQTRQVIEIREPGQDTREIEGYTPAWFPRLLKLAKCGIPALLVGPAGCGKTTAVKMLAQALGRPFHRISIAAGTDEGQLQGWLHPVGDNMRFDYVASVVSHSYEHGGVVLIDDVDLGDPNALGILNAALDNGGWHIPLRHRNPVFTRHEEFYLCMAANTWGHGADRQYVGANQLDERTLSRVRSGQIRCDYDPVLETDLYGNHKAGAAESLVFGHRLRARLRALGGQVRDVSTRDIESRYKMLDQFSVSEAWYSQCADWSETECERIHVVIDHNAMTAELE